jgi:hypothetical protein
MHLGIICGRRRAWRRVIPDKRLTAVTALPVNAIVIDPIDFVGNVTLGKCRKWTCVSGDYHDIIMMIMPNQALIRLPHVEREGCGCMTSTSFKGSQKKILNFDTVPFYY